MKVKLNLKKIIGASIVIVAVHRCGQVVGAYKMANDINDNGIDNPRIKDGLEAAGEIRKALRELKEDFKSHFFGTAANTAEPEPEEEDIFCAECAEVRPVYEETEEEESPNIEVTVNDQPED